MEVYADFHYRIGKSNRLTYLKDLIAIRNVDTGDHDFLWSPLSLCVEDKIISLTLHIAQASSPMTVERRAKEDGTTKSDAHRFFQTITSL